MRLVDADALDVAFQNEEKYFADSVYEFGISDGIALMHSLVDDAPTIDAVPVVRCRECKYYDTEDGDLKCVKDAEWDEDAAMYSGLVMYHLEDYYCTDGQRREGGDGDG